MMRANIGVQRWVIISHHTPVPLLDIQHCVKRDTPILSSLGYTRAQPSSTTH